MLVVLYRTTQKVHSYLVGCVFYASHEKRPDQSPGVCDNMLDPM